MFRQHEKGVREVEKLLKAKEREKKDVTRDVAKQLRGEAKERENIRMITASGRTQTDAAGVKWKHDPQTNWWCWRDSEGEWRSTSHKYTTKEDLDKARISVASGAIVRDVDGVEWKQDAETSWWGWWRDSKGEWRSTNRRYKPSNGPASSSSGESKSVASTASTAATSTPAMSEEYKELQRVQQTLSEIAILEDRKARGDTFNKYEESAVRRKAEFYYDPVMVKHRSDKFRTGKGNGSV